MNSKKYNRISVTKNLDKELVINSAGSDFYAIGLSLFPYINSQRKPLYNPYFVFFVILGYTLKLILSLTIVSSEEKVFLLMGDWTYFLGARYHMSASAITYGILASFSQLTHFWYYWKGIEPSYLEPFKVIAGFLCPIDVGLIEREDVVRLVRRSKWYYMAAKPVLMSRIPVALLLSSVPFFLHSRSPLDLIAALFWVIVFTLWVHFTAGFLIYQILYFSILCFYLKIKVKRLNQKISTAIKSKRAATPQEIKSMAKQFLLVHKEICRTNGNHWSLFLLLVVIACIVICNMCNYTFFFGTLNLVLRVVFLYMSLLFYAFLLFVLMTASSVVIESDKTFTILNFLYARQKDSIKSTPIKFKVRFFVINP